MVPGQLGRGLRPHRRRPPHHFWRRVQPAAGRDRVAGPLPEGGGGVRRRTDRLPAGAHHRHPRRPGDRPRRPARPGCRTGRGVAQRGSRCRWTRPKQAIDAFIAAVDPHAVRRTQTAARGRSVDVVIEDGSGLAAVFATLFAPNAKALDTRLNALADTVCPADPGPRINAAPTPWAPSPTAPTAGLPLRHRGLPRRLNPPSTGVVVYVIAHQDTITAADGPAPRAPTAPS